MLEPTVKRAFRSRTIGYELIYEGSGGHNVQ